MSTNNPIEHVVIIVKENHTFDNYFGAFPGADGDASLAHATDPPPADPPHNHKAWLERARHAVRQQYIEADIPDYFAYARQFTLCDHYFTEVASQSTPNHLMLIAADSPLIDNSHPRDAFQPQPPFDLPSLPKSLEKAGRTWANYGGYAFRYLAGLHNHGANHSSAAGSARFATDAARGALPNVSWVYAPEGLDEHPPHGRSHILGGLPPVVHDGMRWTVDQVNAVVKGGLWPRTAIFITWDDWGGWYDHVEPPNVEAWGGGPPLYHNTQFRYGSRVGCLVLSPYAKAGYISKAFHSHVSLVTFCETIFGVPPLNARDAASDDMADCFDFAQKPAAAP